VHSLLVSCVEWESMLAVTTNQAENQAVLICGHPIESNYPKVWTSEYYFPIKFYYKHQKGHFTF